MRKLTKEGFLIPLENEVWPLTSLEAYERERGPFNVENASRLLDKDTFELYNGWLVLDIGTDFTGAGVAANILEIVITAARIRHFGRTLPDQVECELKNGDVIKPDACLVSDARSNTRVVPRGPDQKKVLQGGPELAVEFRLPNKTTAEEQHKLKLYFENDTSIVWEVDPELEHIWVWQVENPAEYTEYKGDDKIDCEPFFPGWSRRTADFFDKTLTAGELAKETVQQARADERQKERHNSLVEMLMFAVELKFPSNLPADLEERLTKYSKEQLTGLVGTITKSATFVDWLATFPTE